MAAVDWVRGGEVGIVDKDGVDTPKILLKRASFPFYLPTGHLLYAVPGKLMAVRFDLEKQETVGSPITLCDDLRTELIGAAQFSVTSEGTLVYAPGVHATRGSFVWVDRQGKREPIKRLAQRHYGAFVISPDGRKLALSVCDVDGMDVWIHDLGSGTESRFTTGGWWHPDAWLPDGKSLLVGLSESRDYQTFWKPVDSNLAPKKLPAAIPKGWPTSRVRAPNEIVIAGNDFFHIVTIPEDSSHLPDGFKVKAKILRNNFIWPARSPDGRWLAYCSMESNRWEIWVCSFPEMSQKNQISTSGGEEPLWNPNGREVIYRWGDQWFSVDLEFKPELRAMPPRLLFEGPYVNVDGMDWDLHPDGNRFLVIENPQQDRPQTELVVITNLFDLLQAKLPAAK